MISHIQLLCSPRAWLQQDLSRLNSNASIRANLRRFQSTVYHALFNFLSLLAASRKSLNIYSNRFATLPVFIIINLRNLVGEKAACPFIQVLSIHYRIQRKIFIGLDE